MPPWFCQTHGDYKQGKNEFAKCPQPKPKKGFSIQFNSKVYPVPIANMHFNTKPNFLLSKSKSMIEAYKRFIQNMMNSLVEPISNQHKNLLYLAKIQGNTNTDKTYRSHHPTLLDRHALQYNHQISFLKLLISSDWSNNSTLISLTNTPQKFISQTFHFIKLIQQSVP